MKCAALILRTSILFIVLCAGFVSAQEATKPIRYTWIVSSCPTWNCAAAALVMANGKADTIALPTGRDERPWLVLKRVEEGSLFIPEDEPFHCEVFSTVADASLNFATLESCHDPMILNVPDGRAVIVSLSTCTSGAKRRAVN